MFICVHTFPEKKKYLVNIDYLVYVTIFNSSYPGLKDCERCEISIKDHMILKVMETPFEITAMINKVLNWENL